MEDSERFDDALIAALVAVTNIRFGESSLALRALSVCLGGLGIRMARNIALSALNSFLHSARELIDNILNNILLPESNDISAVEKE